MSDKEKEKKGKEEEPLPVSLSTMLGSGDIFMVGNKKYSVKPLKLKDVDEFSKDAVNIGPQMFSLIDKKRRENLDKWMKRQVFDANDEPVSIKKAIDDEWDLTDLRKCVKKIIDISG